MNCPRCGMQLAGVVCLDALCRAAAAAPKGTESNFGPVQYRAKRAEPMWRLGLCCERCSAAWEALDMPLFTDDESDRMLAGEFRDFMERLAAYPADEKRAYGFLQAHGVLPGLPGVRVERLPGWTQISHHVIPVLWSRIPQKATEKPS